MSDDRILLATATSAQTWRALTGMIRTRRLRAIGAAVVLILAAAAGLAGPAVLGAIVDSVIEQEPASAITWLALGLLGAVIVEAALGAWGQILVADVGESALADLREDVVDTVVDLPLGDLERAGTGDLVARVVGDVRVIGTAVTESVGQMAGAALTIALTLVGLGVLDWRYALAGALAIPIQAHTLRWYLRKSGPVYAAERVAEGARAQQLLDTVGGATTVRALRLTAVHLEQVRERSLAAITCTKNAVRLSLRFFARLNIAEFVGLAALLVTGFFLVQNGTSTIGAATTAALYFHRLFDPINIVLGLFDTAQAAAAGLARLVGITANPAPPDHADRITPAETSVSTRGLTHRYDGGVPVLQEIDLVVPEGRRVALVGASGAGKSTLAALLAGVHQPTDGTVRIGALDLRSLGQANTRALVSLVTQEVHVFSGSLAEDLRLAAPTATDDQLLDALEKVGARSWVFALPDGMSTMVGAGGHSLNATQAQQLALARLVLSDRPIVILDEATAEAGSAGARVLESAADAALAGRTSIVVAHRLGQAAAADHIVVLDAGRIIQQGSHEELLDRGGVYRDLWLAWESHREGNGNGH